MNALDERRQFLRPAFHAPARLTVLDRHFQARLLDVSLKGALVEHDGSWTAVNGQMCHLRIELGAGVLIAMQASVAHVDERHIGLHCERIDLDSITHLRQLVEHNAQDPALLERDLANLASSR